MANLRQGRDSSLVNDGSAYVFNIIIAGLLVVSYMIVSQASSSFTNSTIVVFLAFLALYLGWSSWTLEANYRKARSMNIPLIRLPIDPTNVLWLIIQPHFWGMLDRLPINYGAFGSYGRRGWFFPDKASSHLRWGPIFALVTPKDIYVYVCEPEAVHEIFTRREDFLRPSKMYSKC